jgi:hypothetical protein
MILQELLTLTETKHHKVGTIVKHKSTGALATIIAPHFKKGGQSLYPISTAFGYGIWGHNEVEETGESAAVEAGEDAAAGDAGGDAS